MATIQWRPEPNPLTTPTSWRIRFMPRNTAGCKDIAADIAADHPNYNEELAESILELGYEKILRRLINGENVTFTNAFSYTLSFMGRLDGPDDELPPLDECLHIRVHAAPALVEALRQAARLERLPPEKKLPLISTALDTVLGLKDVLNPAGLLRLAGGDMSFDRSRPDEGCVIENTAGGKTAQTRFGKIEDSEIILMPELPAPPHPWNNEYTVSVSARYSEHGSLRTGTYARMLRSPLTLTKMGHPNPPEAGILTGKESSPHVSVTGGSVAADETLRIQAVFDVREDALFFSLLDMQEGGRTGAAVSVTANGAVTLQGFADSAVSSLNIRVNAYAELKEMIRSKYGGRLVDVLKVETA
ncbi:MAG: hypothetical protein ACTFAK_03265 [Candidatus Electronema sp. VV]